MYKDEACTVPVFCLLRDMSPCVSECMLLTGDGDPVEIPQNFFCIFADEPGWLYPGEDDSDE